MNGKFSHGGDIYEREVRLDFSANMNLLGMPEEIKKAVIEALDNSIIYPDTSYRQLKNAIANKYEIKAEQVCVGNGAADLIYTLVRALRPQKAVLISPSFNEYEKALLSIGCELSFYDTKEEQQFQVQEDILNCLLPEHDFLVICNPNNPTGSVVEPELLKQIILRCRECNIFLCIDECFMDFVDSYDPLPIGGYFLLKAFTKIYAMPGLRLGYGMCDRLDVLDKMAFVSQAWSVSNLAQAAGIAALSLEGFEEKSREVVRTERKYMEKVLEDLGFEVYPSRTNYVFFRAYYEEGKQKKLWVTLKEDLLGMGFNLRDCSNYRGLSKGYYRIGLRTREENQELIKSLLFLKKSVDFL